METILLSGHNPFSCALAFALTGSAAHSPLVPALAVTSLFALAGYWLRGVTRAGTLTGFALAFAIYTSAGPRAFAALVALFVVTLLATRLGRQRKLALGTAERSGGRSASQVLANVGIASLFAISYGHFGKSSLLVACAASLAEAAADTVSSECGQAFGAPARLVSNGALVAPGTNGGVSWAGTFCGTLAALGMSLVAIWAHLVTAPQAWIVALAAVCGMFLDSVLGSTLERPGSLNNDAVNLLGTLFAALIALGLGNLLI
jgi:uncharacterized protein (TIGR00297 family)